MITSRALIVHKNPRADNPDACHAGLGVTAGNTAETLREHGYNAEALAVVDGYYLRNKLRLRQYENVTHVAMCAPFFDTIFLRALCAEFRRIHFTVVFHSNVGFLGVDNWSTGILREQVAFERELGPHGNFRVAGNSAKFCHATTAMFDAPCELLPNLYFLHGPIERRRSLWKRGAGTLRIGAFGATRVLKNLPTAAWAAAIISRQLNSETEFWVSSGREEGGGAATVLAGIRKLFAAHPGISLVEAPWSDWLDFRRTAIRKMNLLMQPSFTESFNGVTADGVAEGVPSVVGQAIDWVPSKWITDVDDAVAVARTGMDLLGDKNAARDGYRALVKHNEMAIDAWAGWLETLTGSAKEGGRSPRLPHWMPFSLHLPA